MFITELTLEVVSNRKLNVDGTVELLKLLTLSVLNKGRIYDILKIFDINVNIHLI